MCLGPPTVATKAMSGAAECPDRSTTYNRRTRALCSTILHRTNTHVPLTGQTPWQRPHTHACMSNTPDQAGLIPRQQLHLCVLVSINADTNKYLCILFYYISNTESQAYSRDKYIFVYLETLIQLLIETTAEYYETIRRIKLL